MKKKNNKILKNSKLVPIEEDPKKKIKETKQVKDIAQTKIENIKGEKTINDKKENFLLRKNNEKIISKSKLKKKETNLKENNSNISDKMVLDDVQEKNDKEVTISVNKEIKYFNLYNKALKEFMIYLEKKNSTSYFIDIETLSKVKAKITKSSEEAFLEIIEIMIILSNEKSLEDDSLRSFVLTLFHYLKFINEKSRNKCENKETILKTVLDSLLKLSDKNSIFGLVVLQIIKITCALLLKEKNILIKDEYSFYINEKERSKEIIDSSISRITVEEKTSTKKQIQINSFTYVMNIFLIKQYLKTDLNNMKGILSLILFDNNIKKENSINDTLLKNNITSSIVLNEYSDIQKILQILNVSINENLYIDTQCLLSSILINDNMRLFQSKTSFNQPILILDLFSETLSSRLFERLNLKHHYFSDKLYFNYSFLVIDLVNEYNKLVDSNKNKIICFKNCDLDSSRPFNRFDKSNVSISNDSSIIQNNKNLHCLNCLNYSNNVESEILVKISCSQAIESVNSLEKSNEDIAKCQECKTSNNLNLYTSSNIMFDNKSNKFNVCNLCLLNNHINRNYNDYEEILSITNNSESLVESSREIKNNREEKKMERVDLSLISDLNSDRSAINFLNSNKDFFLDYTQKHMINLLIVHYFNLLKVNTNKNSMTPVKQGGDIIENFYSLIKFIIDKNNNNSYSNNISQEGLKILLNNNLINEVEESYLSSLSLPYEFIQVYLQFNSLFSNNLNNNSSYLEAISTKFKFTSFTKLFIQNSFLNRSFIDYYAFLFSQVIDDSRFKIKQDYIHSLINILIHNEVLFSFVKKHEIVFYLLSSKNVHIVIKGGNFAKNIIVSDLNQAKLNQSFFNIRSKQKSISSKQSDNNKSDIEEFNILMNDNSKKCLILLISTFNILNTSEFQSLSILKSILFSLDIETINFGIDDTTFTYIINALMKPLFSNNYFPSVKKEILFFYYNLLRNNENITDVNQSNINAESKNKFTKNTYSNINFNSNKVMNSIASILIEKIDFNIIKLFGTESLLFNTTNKETFLNMEKIRNYSNIDKRNYTQIENFINLYLKYCFEMKQATIILDLLVKILLHNYIESNIFKLEKFAKSNIIGNKEIKETKSIFRLIIKAIVLLTLIIEGINKNKAEFCNFVYNFIPSILQISTIMIDFISDFSLISKLCTSDDYYCLTVRYLFEYYIKFLRLQDYITFSVGFTKELFLNEFIESHIIRLLKIYFNKINTNTRRYISQTNTVDETFNITQIFQSYRLYNCLLESVFKLILSCINTLSLLQSNIPSCSDNIFFLNQIGNKITVDYILEIRKYRDMRDNEINMHFAMKSFISLISILSTTINFSIEEERYNISLNDSQSSSINKYKNIFTKNLLDIYEHEFDSFRTISKTLEREPYHSNNTQNSTNNNYYYSQLLLEFIYCVIEKIINESYLKINDNPDNLMDRIMICFKTLSKSNNLLFHLIYQFYYTIESNISFIINSKLTEKIFTLLIQYNNHTSASLDLVYKAIDRFITSYNNSSLSDNNIYPPLLYQRIISLTNTLLNNDFAIKSIKDCYSVISKGNNNIIDVYFDDKTLSSLELIVNLLKNGNTDKYTYFSKLFSLQFSNNADISELSISVISNILNTCGEKNIEIIDLINLSIEDSFYNLITSKQKQEHFNNNTNPIFLYITTDSNKLSILTNLISQASEIKMKKKLEKVLLTKINSLFYSYEKQLINNIPKLEVNNFNTSKEYTEEVVNRLNIYICYLIYIAIIIGDYSFISYNVLKFIVRGLKESIQSSLNLIKTKINSVFSKIEKADKNNNKNKSLTSQSSNKENSNLNNQKNKTTTAKNIKTNNVILDDDSSNEDEILECNLFLNLLKINFNMMFRNNEKNIDHLSQEKLDLSEINVLYSLVLIVVKLNLLNYLCLKWNLNKQGNNSNLVNKDSLKDSFLNEDKILSENITNPHDSKDSDVDKLVKNPFHTKSDNKLKGNNKKEFYSLSCSLETPFCKAIGLLSSNISSFIQTTSIISNNKNLVVKIFKKELNKIILANEMSLVKYKKTFLANVIDN